MKCLKCGDEYRDDIQMCAECQIPLVPDNYQGKENSVEKDLPLAKEEEQKEEEQSSILEKICDHLEVLQFEIQRDGEIISATHKKFNRFLLTEYEGGVLFEIWLKPQEFAEENHASYFKFINIFLYNYSFICFTC